MRTLLAGGMGAMFDFWDGRCVVRLTTSGLVVGLLEALFGCCSPDVSDGVLACHTVGSGFHLRGIAERFVSASP